MVNRNCIAWKARSLDQKRLWCKQIKKIILDNYNAVIPDKAKELVMMLGNKVEGRVQSKVPIIQPVKTLVVVVVVDSRG